MFIYVISVLVFESRRHLQEFRADRSRPVQKYINALKDMGTISVAPVDGLSTLRVAELELPSGRKIHRMGKSTNEAIELLYDDAKVRLFNLIKTP